MFAHYILAGATFLALFIMFLVIARTLNNIINVLIKIQYLVQKEYDLKKELLEVRRLMDEEAGEKAEGAPAKKTDSGAAKKGT